MRIPLQVKFRNMPHSDAIEAKIIEKSVKLEKFYDRIMGCRVVVEETQRRHHQGNVYSVRIDVTVPGKESPPNRWPSRSLCKNWFLLRLPGSCSPRTLLMEGATKS